MVPGRRITTWLKSPSPASGGDSHRANKGDASDIVPAATGTTAAASNVAGDAGSPVPAQIEATPQATTTTGPAYRLDSKMADEYLKKIKRFRILVMGRANAGKTTIIQRVCNSTDMPEIFGGNGNKYFQRGYHDIQNELVFESNSGFVFYDSCGFEAGSTRQFDQMKHFVADHAVTTRVNERIHAIWFCIPMTDSHRPVTAAERKFFNECDTGHVPVIVLVTKVDVLYLTAIEELLDGGLTIAEAEARAIEKQGELLDKWLGHVKHELEMCKFPPKGYVSLQKMHQEDADCTPVIECTANVLNENYLQRLLIVTCWISHLLKVTSVGAEALRQQRACNIPGLTSRA
ncbi:hypothetical protein EDC04DRAFT_3064009 [Pisolithus marmoratus]|nr:hypothetical protein EDC04DRAFT_3064009 [Pisolithus marmoratus]